LLSDPEISKLIFVPVHSVLLFTKFNLLSVTSHTNSLADGKPYTSTVTWTLKPKQNGTDLQLLHNGFTAMEDQAAHNDGWTRIGNKIAKQLNAVMYDCTNA